MPITLAESFAVVPTNRFHDYPRKPGDAHATISGASTSNTDAPKFAVASPALFWQQRGTAVVQNLASGWQNAHHNNNMPLNTEFLSEREPATYHASEGDVIRSSAVYLLHPVN